MTPRLCVGAVALLCSPALAAAQDTASVEVRQPASVHHRRDVALRPVLGLHVGGPQRLAVAVGVQRAVSSGVDGYSARFLALEAGRGGGKLALGLASGTALTFGQVRVVVLRTWGEPRELTVDQTYGGLELRVNIAVTLGVGAYVRVAGAAPGDTRMLAATVGVGL